MGLNTFFHLFKSHHFVINFSSSISDGHVKSSKFLNAFRGAHKRLLGIYAYSYCKMVPLWYFKIIKGKNFSVIFIGSKYCFLCLSFPAFFKKSCGLFIWSDSKSITSLGKYLVSFEFTFNHWRPDVHKKVLLSILRKSYLKLLPGDWNFNPFPTSLSKSNPLWKSEQNWFNYLKVKWPSYNKTLVLLQW